MDLELGDVKRPTRGLARVLEPLAADYDYVFLDCPPAISLASESVFGAADVLLVPLIPSPLSLRTFDQLHRVRRRRGREAAADPRVLLDGRRPQAAAPRGHRGAVGGRTTGVLSSAIPAVADIERMSVHRRVIAQTAPRSRAGQAYDALWAELRGGL